MNNGLRKNEKGFTIIEVVLVLAIAGLIFLIVFLALPQLQRSRRDTQRRGDAGRILAALETSAGNSNGTYPAEAAWANFRTAYLPPAEYSDPQRGVYGAPGGTAIALGAGAPGPLAGDVRYGLGEACDPTGNLVAGGVRDAGITMRLEQGVFCQDNR